MVSVGVSRMGKAGIIFIEPGTKVSSSYYCELVVGEGLLPDSEPSVVSTGGLSSRRKTCLGCTAAGWAH